MTPSIPSDIIHLPFPDSPAGLDALSVDNPRFARLPSLIGQLSIHCRSEYVQ